MNPDTQGTTKKKPAFQKILITTQPLTVQIIYRIKN